MPKKWLIPIVLILVITSVAVSVYSGIISPIPTVEENKRIDKLDFIVISDLHYLSPKLGIDQAAYKHSLYTETKLSEDSRFIIDAFVEKLSFVATKFIIVTGDLTHNGEKICHQEVIEKLNKLRKAGKRVFVIPGNHDINNPMAFKYQGNNQIKTESISPDEFASMYADYGYNEAYSRDKHSLSYAVNMDSTFVFIGLDACRYKENTPSKSYSGGTLSGNTLVWLEHILIDAKNKGKRPFISMHHGLIEHFPGQSLNPISAEYILSNSHQLISLLRKYDVKLVFTGHFHANDIATVAENLYDIETGSAITYPHSYRIIKIEDYTMTVQTINIDEVKLNTGRMSFKEYSIKKTMKGLENYFNNNWKRANSVYPDSIVRKLRNEFAKAVLAHYYGDEIMPKSSAMFVAELEKSNDSFMKLIGIALKGIYSDGMPADRDLMIELK